MNLDIIYDLDGGGVPNCGVWPARAVSTVCSLFLGAPQIYRPQRDLPEAWLGLPITAADFKIWNRLPEQTLFDTWFEISPIFDLLL